MTTSSDGSDTSIPVEFKEKYGLDDDWEVRFTADELRAREMAKQYSAAGYEVRVLPLQPDGEVLDVEALEEFSDGLDLEHDPLQYIQEENCATCLDDTFVVFTKGDQSEPTDVAETDLVFELDQ